MQSYYEINVALNGSHFFATAPRSCTTKARYEQCLRVIRQKFPPEEGYHVTAMYWDCKGTFLRTEEVKE